MDTFSFRKYQPLSLRLWHWLNAFAILGLLATVLLRKTFLSWRTNAALIEGKLQEAGTAITPELAKDIAVSIRNPMWDWHIYLGFALAILIVVRIVVAGFVEKKGPAGEALATARKLGKVDSSLRDKALHFTAVKTGYALFYLSTLFMVTSGLLMNFKAELGIGKEWINSLKETHELMMWFFVIFIVGHLIGLVMAELREDKGIVSDMIHGGKKD